MTFYLEDILLRVNYHEPLNRSILCYPTDFACPLKVHYATFYGPINAQRDSALHTRNSSLHNAMLI